ncbi:DUF1217 domain-containing protein [Nitratireductor aquimarinus]|uniref:DUF1217 domain-containing protein n=1 Tax=Alphaproteobacteria TaxID=28211 RepID=UPI000DE155F5|nr:MULTISPECIES: DUF1217 domain-containing protein [Alphaproteobacteria]MBY6021689.1 DUF1217 domain-containing protein [Nitratireductor sp. DP7N14-4]MBN7756720.1 DUF1217 domain-containing protein [Nitratireductor aquimarinus]MBY5999664.1 DUF1217 domain-containing protein [Tritonibacter mobilis]MCV0381253.1 DUF1217 domain-containing protein [Nitratireductor sp.]MDJ1462975.1 DUF1217 domain-containing protein [Nitratireductor sp. GZWM139]
MINTFTSYNLINRDLSRSLERVQSQPMVQRETEYYQQNIGRVTSIEEFVNDDRLFRYAMKAHGLEDMAYAKAFMVKVLEEGISDPESFANKLTDKRYIEFARTYNFAAGGPDTTNYNPAQKGTVDKYLTRAIKNGVPPNDPTLIASLNNYLAKIPDIKSVDDLMGDQEMLTFALMAHGFDVEEVIDLRFLRSVLEGGIDDPQSPANQTEDKRYRALAEAFNFARYGEDATTYNIANNLAVERYMRQTLEEDAGKENEGVRLALYFQRKAPEFRSYYELLADKAIAQVVRTALGFPPALAQADIDKQVEMIKERVEIADFKDPEKLEDFLKRFTTMWELENPSGSQQTSIAALFSQPAEFGISTDMLFTIAQLKR